MHWLHVVWLVLEARCRLHGGHDEVEHWRRVPRPEGGVDLELYRECTRCPKTTPWDGCEPATELDGINT